MTNDDIKEAARLVESIEDLEKAVRGLGNTGGVFLMGDTLGVTGYRPTLARLTADLARSILGQVIDAKKARLNDLRAGC